MQGLPVHFRHRFGDLGGQRVDLGAEGRTVFGIADKRMSHMFQMNADLVRPPGFKPAIHQGCRSRCSVSCAKPLFDFVMGHGVTRVGSLRAMDRTLCPV